MQNIQLNNGIEMPILGFGVYQIDESECERCVREAIEVGYRSIDTASAYFNEAAVGRAIKSCGVPREELFITTKLWVKDASYDGAKRAFEKSMRLLGLDYLDLYLIHHPYNDVYGAWKAMQELYHQGRIRALGVANFYPDRLLDFVYYSGFTPAVNQVETHPFNQNGYAQEFMQKLGVAMESWGPFAEGRNNLFSNPVLKTIADKYEKSVAQVVLRWLTQRGIIVIPKSTHRERMIQNLDSFSFDLSEEDLRSIAALDEGKSLFFDLRDPATVKMIHDYC